MEVTWRELEPPPGARAGAQTRVLGISELLRAAVTPGQPELCSPGFPVDLVSGPCLVSCRVLDPAPEAAGRVLSLIGCHDLCGCEELASVVPAFGALGCYLVAGLFCLGLVWDLARHRRDPGEITA